MASKTIYLTVRLDIYNPNTEEITEEDVDEIVSEVDYEFKNYKEYEIDTENLRTKRRGWYLENIQTGRSSHCSPISCGAGNGVRLPPTCTSASTAQRTTVM